MSKYDQPSVRPDDMVDEKVENQVEVGKYISYDEMKNQVSRFLGVDASDIERVIKIQKITRYVDVQWRINKAEINDDGKPVVEINKAGAKAMYRITVGEPILQKVKGSDVSRTIYAPVLTKFELKYDRPGMGHGPDKDEPWNA